MKTHKFLTKVIQMLCQEFNTAPACDMPELAEAICKVHKLGSPPPVRGKD